MNEARFERLTQRQQMAWAIGAAARVFGRDQVADHVQHIAPLVQDRVGHRDYSDPADNFWHGVWQVYRAD